MQKFDVVVEAVRYKNGKIELVRVYERRGASFTDRILMDRKTLLERLKDGKRFVTGQRKEYLASTFEVGKPVKLVGGDGKQVVTTCLPSCPASVTGLPTSNVPPRYSLRWPVTQCLPAFRRSRRDLRSSRTRSVKAAPRRS